MLAIEQRAKRLSTVDDQDRACALADALQGRQVTRGAEGVGGYDKVNLLVDLRRQLIWIEAEALGIDIDEPRRQAVPQHCVQAGGKAERGHEHTRPRLEP